MTSITDIRVLNKPTVLETNDKMVKVPLETMMDIIKSEHNKKYTDQIRHYAKLEMDRSLTDSDRKHFAAQKLEVKQQNLTPFYLYSEENGKIYPTGLFVFDPELSANPDVDFEEVKEKLQELSNFVPFYFDSPSCSLKFGVYTDFKRNSDDETKQSINKRFAQAYSILESFFADRLGLEFDDCMKSIYQAVFTSYDPDCYVNYNPLVPFEINDKTAYKERKRVSYQEKTMTSSVAEMWLNRINKCRNWDQRRQVNFACFKLFDDKACDMLENFWIVDDTDKLKRDLASQYESYLNSDNKLNKFAALNFIKRCACEDGYKPPKGREQLIDKPVIQDIDQIDFLCDAEGFVDLISKETAQDKIKTLYKKFFAEQKNILIKASTGIGKTKMLAQMLAVIPKTLNVLILADRHDVADKFMEKVNEYNLESEIVHLKGKSVACENNEVKQLYENEQENIPVDVCLHCPLFNNCGYINQFKDKSHIRIMTHEEWQGISSTFFDGLDLTQEEYKEVRNKQSVIVKDSESQQMKVIPKRSFRKNKYNKDITCFRWVPDLIVIDENPVKPSRIIHNQNDGYQSVDNIIQDLKNNPAMPLGEAIRNNAEWVILDLINIKEGSKTKPILESAKKKAIENHLKNIKSWNRNNLKFSKMIWAFRQFLKTENHIFIEKIQPKMRIDTETNTKKLELWMSEYHAGNNPKWKNVPTLILDATAHEAIIDEVLPAYQFEKVLVEKSKNVIIKQLSNKSVSRGWLLTKTNDAYENINIILAGLEEIIKSEQPEKLIGVISYGKLGDFSENFSEYIATELAKKFPDKEFVHNYFKNIRGTNDFEDCDLLLVVGRHYSTDEILQHTLALGGNMSNEETEIADIPVRMTNGKMGFIKHRLFLDHDVQSAYESSVCSEQEQVIGRGRLIWGKPKTIVIVSNAYLGDTVEIDELFNWGQYFFPKKFIKIRAIMQAIRDGLGAVEWKKNALLETGITRYYLETEEEKKQLLEAFLELGFKLFEVKVMFPNRHSKTKNILAVDKEHAEQYLMLRGFTLKKEQ